MAKEKKSAKADKKRNSKSAAAYTGTFRRYFNKIKRVKQHVKRTHDDNAREWLADAQKMLAMDYVRGSEKVKALHAKYFT